MSQEWIDYLQALAEWYADEVKRAIGTGTGAQPDLGPGGPPPTKPGPHL